jgi:hypothetical protein
MESSIRAVLVRFGKFWVIASGFMTISPNLTSSPVIDLKFFRAFREMKKVALVVIGAKRFPFDLFDRVSALRSE